MWVWGVKVGLEGGMPSRTYLHVIKRDFPLTYCHFTLFHWLFSSCLLDVLCQGLLCLGWEETFLVFAGVLAWAFHALEFALPCVVQLCPSVLLVRCLAIGIVLLFHTCDPANLFCKSILGLGVFELGLTLALLSVVVILGPWGLMLVWLGFGDNSLRSAH